MVYRFYCIWENRRRDRTGTNEAFDHAYEDDLTDRKVRCSSEVTRDVQKLTNRRIRNSGTSIEACGLIGPATLAWRGRRKELDTGRELKE